MISYCKPIAFILAVFLLCDKSASSSDEELKNYLTETKEAKKIMVVGTGKKYRTPYPKNYFLVDNNEKHEPTKVANIENGHEFSDQYDGVFDVVVFECVPLLTLDPYKNVARFLKDGGKFITSFPGKVDLIPPSHELSLSPLDKDSIFFRDKDVPSGSTRYTVYVDRKTKINSDIQEKGREEILKIFSQDTGLIFKDFEIIQSSDYWKKEAKVHGRLIEATKR